MQEVTPGVWHWTARHPEWNERQTDWGPDVSSFAIDDGEHLLLFDPVAPPTLVDELAAGRQPIVVLTCPWHRRDTADVVERLGAKVFVPPPDEGDPEPVRGQVFREGETLPFGVRAYAGMEENDLSLWVESRGALVFGDTLMDRGNGLSFARDWDEKGAIAARGVPVDRILEGLQPLRELPVEHVLLSHWSPVIGGGQAALERALA